MKSCTVNFSLHRVSKRMPVGVIGMALLATFPIGGCTTVESKPVRDGKPIKGLTYCLPKPAIRVVPQGDGTIDVGVEYVPDPDHTYWLSTSSYVTSHKAQVQREQGMLTKFQWSSNAAGAATDMVKASGEVTASVIGSQIKAQSEAATNLKTYDEAVLDAEQAVKLDEVAVTNAGTDAAKLAAANLALAQDKVKLETAKGKRDAERQRLASTPATPTAPTVADVTPGTVGGTLVDAAALGTPSITHNAYTISGGVSKPQKVWGPVLFSIDERVLVDEDGSQRPTVVLRAVRTNVNSWAEIVQKSGTQLQFETAAPPAASLQAAAPPGALITPEAVNFVHGGEQQVLLTPASGHPVASTGQAAITRIVNGTNEAYSGAAASVRVEANGKLTLTINPKLPPGTYEIRFPLIGPNHLPAGTATVKVTVTDGQ